MKITTPEQFVYLDADALKKVIQESIETRFGRKVRHVSFDRFDPKVHCYLEPEKKGAAPAEPSKVSVRSMPCELSSLLSQSAAMLEKTLPAILGEAINYLFNGADKLHGMDRLWVAQDIGGKWWAYESMPSADKGHWTCDKRCKVLDMLNYAVETAPEMWAMRLFSVAAA